MLPAQHLTLRCLTVLFLSAVIPAMAWAAPPAADAANATTTVYLVRHAEKADGDDPTLSPSGQTRAITLAHVLADAGLSAVFVTDTRRSRDTAAPVAAATGLAATRYDARDAQALAATVRADHAGQAVLVVGHSNTLDDLAAAFGAHGLADLDESQYDRLYVVQAGSNDVRLLQLRYGTPTH
ncbi:MAG: histidine phosphatase family protein [Xanthomonadales bacterium]|nr:histidine phosphatase family protein [Xanthomonadales bacterium]